MAAKFEILSLYSVVPKSTNPEHIKANIELEVDSLCTNEIQLLDNLEHGCKYAWNSDTVK